MENYLQSIITLQDHLQQAGIASIVIGGVAVAAWGEPRVTRDVDLYKLISTRLREHEDANRVIRRQGNNLDDEYVIGWLKKFKKALGDSMLVTEYQNLRRKAGRKI